MMTGTVTVTVADQGHVTGVKGKGLETGVHPALGTTAGAVMTVTGAVMIEEVEMIVEAGMTGVMIVMVVVVVLVAMEVVEIAAKIKTIKMDSATGVAKVEFVNERNVIGCFNFTIL